MSVYQIEKLCYRAMHDEAFRDALAKDPEAAVARLPLTAEEREILRNGEVEKFYLMGAHPYLLGHIARLEIFGITAERYRERMRLIKED